MSACCTTAGQVKGPKWARRIREGVAWILPSTMLVLMPKCPACLAAYVVLWTGLGVSMSAAAYLRWTLLSVSVAALLVLVAARLYRVCIKTSQPPGVR